MEEQRLESYLSMPEFSLTMNEDDKNHISNIFSDTSSLTVDPMLFLYWYFCTWFLHRRKGIWKDCPLFRAQIYSNNILQTWLQIWWYIGKIERYGWTNVTDIWINTWHTSHTWLCWFLDTTLAILDALDGNNFLVDNTTNQLWNCIITHKDSHGSEDIRKPKLIRSVTAYVCHCFRAFSYYIPWRNYEIFISNSLTRQQQAIWPPEDSWNVGR